MTGPTGPAGGPTGPAGPTGPDGVLLFSGYGDSAVTNGITYLANRGVEIALEPPQTIAPKFPVGVRSFTTLRVNLRSVILTGVNITVSLLKNGAFAGPSVSFTGPDFGGVDSNVFAPVSYAATDTLDLHVETQSGIGNVRVSVSATLS